MRSLPKPANEEGDAMLPTDVYQKCVSMVKNSILRGELAALGNHVGKASEEYDVKGASGDFYRIAPHCDVGGVPGTELIKVYTQRMVPKNARGRSLYDRILAVPMHAKCPLCGIGTVNTLDHYLPKTYFPVFSVTPNNLVPSCKWCQGEKGEYFSVTKGEQLLHPYFDDVDGEIWLVAKAVVGVPAAFSYSASPPVSWGRIYSKRLSRHLKELNLPALYSSNAGSRLSEIRYRLTKLYEAGGEGAVRSHLREELVSSEADSLNSWTSAMLRGALESSWFCKGGFRET